MEKCTIGDLYLPCLPRTISFPEGREAMTSGTGTELACFAGNWTLRRTGKGRLKQILRRRMNDKNWNGKNCKIPNWRILNLVLYGSIKYLRSRQSYACQIFYLSRLTCLTYIKSAAGRFIGIVWLILGAQTSDACGIRTIVRRFSAALPVRCPPLLSIR